MKPRDFGRLLRSSRKSKTDLSRSLLSRLNVRAAGANDSPVSMDVRMEPSLRCINVALEMSALLIESPDS